MVLFRQVWDYVGQRSSGAAHRIVQGMRHRIELGDAEMARKYGADSAVPAWRERPACSRCDRRNIDAVVNET